MRTCKTYNRSAFTLVEMLVAMALTIFIMLILTQAFIIAIDTFSSLKAIGDAQEQLRAAANVMRYDLLQDHLEGKRRPSDPSTITQRASAGFLSFYTPSLSVTAEVNVNSPLVTNVLPGLAGVAPGMAVTSTPPGIIPPDTYVVRVNGPNSCTLSNVAAATTTVANPATLNFFPYSIAEGTDFDNMPSWRSKYAVHMTCRLRSDQQQSFFTTQILDPVHANNTNIQFFNLQTMYGMNPTNPQTYGADADATLRPNYANVPQPLSLINPPVYPNPPFNAAPAPNVPPNYPTGPYFYRGQWAEVVYFLGSPTLGPWMPTGTTEEPLNPNGVGVPLYGLYRALYVVAPETDVINAAQFPGYINYPPWALNQSYVGMACNPTGPVPPANAMVSPPMFFHSPQDLAGGVFWTLSPVGPPAGGTFTITYNGTTTAPIPVGANAGGIQAALQNLPNVGPGDIALVAGGPLNAGPVLIQFAGPTQITLDARRVIAGSIRLAPWRTFDPTTIGGGSLRNATLVVPNVLSFDARAVVGALNANGVNTPAIVDMVYDSATTPNPILGVSISLRVWDNKSRLARQLTLTQDL